MGSRKPSLSLRCAATLFIVAFLVSANAAEIRHRDGIHRVSKTPPQVTPGPRLDRRAVTACPASYSLCPPNLGGGCCAAGYECATESCYATTNGPVSCNGNPGYFACGADVGGGCCPVGRVCQRGSNCVPASGVSYSHNCGENSYLCPSEVGYGCCRNGLACGKTQCYATEPVTFVFTKTMTTTDGGDTKTLTSTVTTTSTPTVGAEPSGTASETEFIKFYPSAVPKVDPLITDTTDGGGGGLSSAQIGGAVGGALALLAIILTAAFFIIRRLNHVAKVVKESGPPPTTPGSQADKQDYFNHKHRESEVDSFSTELASTSSPRTRHRSASTDTSEPASSIFGPQSTPGGGSSGYSSRRHSHRSSADSTAGRSTPGTWTRSNSTARSSTRASGSVDGAVSCETTEADEIAELEAGERIVELPADPVARKTEAVATTPMGNAAMNLAPPPPLPGQGQGHKRNNSAAGRGAPQLDVVSEAGEFHGYYGPADRLMGQTGAGQKAT